MSVDEIISTYGFTYRGWGWQGNYELSSSKSNCDHSAGYTTLKKSNGSYAAFCKSCGTEYTLPALDTSTAGRYVVTGENTLCNDPYSDSKTNTKLYKNDTVEIAGSLKNAYGNLWYKTTSNQWIFSGYLTMAQKYVIDVNGLLDDVERGFTQGYGTFDVYIDGKQVADDVNDYYTYWPTGTKYEIKDIKALDGCVYNGVVGGSISGTVGTQQVNIRLSFSKNSYTIAIRAELQSVEYADTPFNATFDVYIDGKLDANDVSAYSKSWPTGTKYEIKDIKTSDCYRFQSPRTDYLSGKVGTFSIIHPLPFVKNYAIDVNGRIDGKEVTSLSEYATFDVYIDGELAANDFYDYYAYWPTGTKYEIKDIKAKDGYQYTGAGTDKVTGTVGSELTTLYLSFSKNGGSEVHFEQQTIYFQGQFSDVPADQWFTANVKSAFELGLMKGNGNGSFNPYGDVSIVEAIVMASRVHSIYYTGGENFRSAAAGETWYQPYLDYAYSNGVISRAYYNADVTQKATRAQFAEIFANALPDEGLYAMNSVTDNAIPDVPMSAAYAKYVYRLYRAGILAGSDANGTFHPSTYITRVEAAAIVSRMAESDNRVSLTLG